MSIAYTYAMDQIARGNIDLLNDTLKVALVATATTIHLEEDAQNLSAFTSLDELGGTGYTGGPGGSGRKTLTGKSLTVLEDPSADVKFDADNVLWGALTPGENIKGYLLYKHVSAVDDSLNIPILCGIPVESFNPAGSALELVWNSFYGVCVFQGNRETDGTSNVSFWYSNAISEIVKGNIDLLGDTLKVLLVGASTTAQMNREAQFIADPGGGETFISTLDEIVAGDYSRKTLTTPSYSYLPLLDRTQFHGDAVTWTTLTPGENVVGALLFKEVAPADDTQNVPIAWWSQHGFPVNPAGAQFQLKWDTTIGIGWFQGAV